MILINAEGLGHMLGHLTTVARQHHRLPHTEGLQGGDGLSTVRLDLIVDDDMSGIRPVDGHMDHRTRAVLIVALRTVVPLGTHGIHHLRVAHIDH